MLTRWLGRDEVAEPPVVVLGAGLAGAAAAWRLTESRREVVLVEAVSPAHAGGSSHGSARIFRHAYPDPFYVGLTLRAAEGWRQLEHATDEELLTLTGGLDFGSRRDVSAIRLALEAEDVPHEVLDAREARARWPQLAFEGPVLHQPGAGVIDAERAVRAMIALAQDAGAEVIHGDPVVLIRERADDVDVHLAGGRTVRASSVVIAVGAWLPEFLRTLPAGLADRVPALTVTEQPVFHFRFPWQLRDPADWPVFVDEGRLSIYALPGGRDAGHAGFKIAEHDVGTVTTASGRTGDIGADARDRVVRYVRRMLPGVDPTPYAETTCLYTRTSDEDFVIDRVGRIVLASPCSGHGAKFAPLIGSMIARAAVDRADVIPGRFRLGNRAEADRRAFRLTSAASAE